MANPSEPAAGWVVLARIAKTQGRRGELAADLLTDIPGRFDQLQQVWLRAGVAPPQAFTLAGHWPHQGRIVLRLEGLTDMTAAAAWRGATVEVPRAQRAPAPEGRYFVSDLEGCAVFDRGRELGRVTEVEAVAGAAPLLHVATDSAGDVLIPFAAEYLRRVDLDAARLDLELPEGLVDINRPAPPKV